MHSANSLFHFVNSPDYLQDALKRKALFPRYCIEDFGYLDISVEGVRYDKIAILQKCFCDIPLRTITNQFRVSLVNDNSLTDAQRQAIPETYSHTALYGQYGLAFTKSWGESNNLQPIHYLNDKADYAAKVSKMINAASSCEDVSDDITNPIIGLLNYIKPIRGVMKRKYTDENNSFVFEIYKNFHDEHEWRYVPVQYEPSEQNMGIVIANPNIVNNQDMINSLNDQVKQNKYASLNFNYDDINYIIVPNNEKRMDIINFIRNLSSSCFERQNEDAQKCLLISKILVLDEIEKDF